MDFQYKVRTAEGKVVTGVREAANKAMAMRELKESGYQPIAVIPIPSGPSLASQGKSFWQMDIPLPSFEAGTKMEDILILTRDLLSIVHAGIPLISGLQDMVPQVKKGKMRKALERIVMDVSAGQKLSDAFSRHPRIFSDLYCNTLRAGEDAGRLEEILERLVKTIERDMETMNTVKNAVRYPIIVLSFLAGAFVLITLFVIPQISKIFSQFGTQLPLPTRLLIGFGDFSTHHGALSLAGAAALVIALSFYQKTEQGRYMMDAARFRLPVFGNLIKKIAIAKFTSTLQSLYASGIMLPEALDISARVTGNAVLAREITHVSFSIRQGKKFSETLAACSLFPPLVVRMLSMGERTGTLEEMLGDVTRHYDREVDYITKSLTTLIEPVLTVGLGIMVLVLALGVFLPMWNMMNLFHH